MNENSTPLYDVAIIGAGIAGMTAALYLLRNHQKVLLLENAGYGGQILEAPIVENYPGFAKVSGPELSEHIYQQLKSLGLSLTYDKIKHLEKTTTHFTLTGNQTYTAKSVILATGTTPRRLNLINESELIGHGISYCATCDGAFYQNQTVAVVGGGNSALLAASYLSHIAKKVFLIHRRSHFTAEKALVSQIQNSANIEILYNQEILACHANEDNHLDSLILKNQQVLPVSSLFVEIGRLSSLTEIFKDNNLKSLLLFDQSGFIITDDTCSTNLAGLFAAGDCRSKNFRQLVTASSDGAIAANSAIEFLSQLSE